MRSSVKPFGWRHDPQGPVSVGRGGYGGSMVSGFDWPTIGEAVLAIGILGALLQAATLWAFARLAR